MEEEDVKSEDDEVVQEKHVVEMEKGFGTIEKTGINLSLSLLHLRILKTQ